MTPSWFENQINPHPDPSDGCHPDEAHALQEYTQGKINARKAAFAITRPSLDTPHEPDPTNLWNLLIDALIEWPDTETAPLLRLLRAIEGVPGPTVGPNQYWSDLPRFGGEWADLFHWGEWEQEGGVDDLEVRATLRDKYTKVARVEAKIVQMGTLRIPINWGYAYIADGLECSKSVLDFRVPMAAECIRVLVERFHLGALIGEKSWALRTSHLDLWKEGDRMSMQRWAFWKSRLSEYAQTDSPMRDTVQEAIRLMEEVE